MILFQYPNIQYMYSIGVVNMNDTTSLDISPYIVELQPSYVPYLELTIINSTSYYCDIHDSVFCTHCTSDSVITTRHDVMMLCSWPAVGGLLNTGALQQTIVYTFLSNKCNLFTKIQQMKFQARHSVKFNTLHSLNEINNTCDKF